MDFDFFVMQIFILLFPLQMRIWRLCCPARRMTPSSGFRGDRLTSHAIAAASTNIVYSSA